MFMYTVSGLQAQTYRLAFFILKIIELRFSRTIKFVNYCPVEFHKNTNELFKYYIDKIIFPNPRE